jgi:hypothetical protein
MGEIISQDVSGRLKRSLGHYTDLTSLTSQLATRALQTDLNITNANISLKVDKSYVDTKFGSMGNSKTFKGTCTFSTLPTSGNTVDDYWYVSDQTTNYCWNGSSWVNIGNGLNINRGTITADKTNFLYAGVNKFNKSTISDGFSIDAGTGNLNTNAGYFASDFIPVSPSTTYANNNSNHVAFYDLNYTFISSLNVVTNFTTPANCSYVRIDHVKGTSITIDQLMVALGTSLPYYVPFGYTFNQNFEPPINSIGYEKTKFLTLGTNIFNKNTVINNYSLTAGTGTLTVNTGYITSDFIPVSPSTAYANNNSNHIMFYDVNYKYISGLNAVTKFSTPSNCYYIRIDHVNSTVTIDQVMVVQGNSLPTAYVAFGYKFKDNFELPSLIKIPASNTNFFQRTVNLFDVTTIVDGYVIASGAGTLTANSGYVTSDYIPVSASTVYANNNSNHVAFYDANKVFISNVNAVKTFTTPSNCAYIRIDHVKLVSSPVNQVMVVQGNSLPTSFTPYYQIVYQPQSKKSVFDGSILGTYGDSIVAIGNTNGVGSWQDYVVKDYGFANHYGRGVGGSCFTWNGTPTWFANSDGSYADRPPNAQPANTTVHKGYFSSWDRIKTMFPASIKDTINVMYIMGGTNDNGYPIGDTVFDSSNVTDPEWSAETTYREFTGDYNLSTFKGAIASTIMKFQAWMPNAIIVLGTQLSGQTNVAGGDRTSQITNALGLKASDYAQALKEVAFEFSTPYVDVFGTTGINQLNSKLFIKDGTHPYDIDGTNKGNRTLARAVIGGLKNIVPLPVQ